MKKWTIIWASLSLMLGACSSKEDKAAENGDNGKLTVYTTIYPLEYFAERIGGGTVEAESIVPAGADEHTYEPTSKTMLELAEADLFLYNGLNLEPFAEKMEKTLAQENVAIINVGEHIDEASHEGHGHEEEAEEEAHGHEEEAADDGHDHGGIDPHIWIDPLQAVEMAEVIKNELTALNPEKEKAYTEHFNELKTDLEKLDEDFHTMADAAEKKEILVSHAAYGYWEKSYGIEQMSVAGLSPTDEPSQKELKEIADKAKEHGIKYVIFEQNVTPKVAEVVQNEIGANALRLHNLATLTKTDIQNGEDYFSIMKQNIETLKTAMQE